MPRRKSKSRYGKKEEVKQKAIETCDEKRQNNKRLAKDTGEHDRVTKKPKRAKEPSMEEIEAAIARSKQKYHELMRDGKLRAIPKGAWVAVDSTMGVIAFHNDREKVDMVVHPLFWSGEVIGPFYCRHNVPNTPLRNNSAYFNNIGVHGRVSMAVANIGGLAPAQTVIAGGVGATSRTVLGRTPAGVRANAGGTCPIFRHQTDDRGWTFCQTKVTAAGGAKNVKMLLDWGANGSYVPSKMRNAPPGQQYDVTIAGGATASVQSYTHYIRCQGLLTRVDAVIGDQMLGTDILTRFNHTINPILTPANDAARKGWWTVTIKPGQVNDP